MADAGDSQQPQDDQSLPQPSNGVSSTFKHIQPQQLIDEALARYHERQNRPAPPGRKLSQAEKPRPRSYTNADQRSGAKAGSQVLPASNKQIEDDLHQMGFSAGEVKTMMQYQEPVVDGLAQRHDYRATKIGLRVTVTGYQPLLMYPDQQDLQDWILHDHQMDYEEVSGRKCPLEHKQHLKWKANNDTALIFNLTTHEFRLTKDLGVVYKLPIMAGALGPVLINGKGEGGRQNRVQSLPGARPEGLPDLPEGMGGPMLRQEILDEPAQTQTLAPEAVPKPRSSQGRNKKRVRQNDEEDNDRPIKVPRQDIYKDDGILETPPGSPPAPDEREPSGTHQQWPSSDVDEVRTPERGRPKKKTAGKVRFNEMKSADDGSQEPLDGVREDAPEPNEKAKDKGKSKKRKVDEDAAADDEDDGPSKKKAKSGRPAEGGLKATDAIDDPAAASSSSKPKKSLAAKKGGARKKTNNDSEALSAPTSAAGSRPKKAPKSRKKELQGSDAPADTPQPELAPSSGRKAGGKRSRTQLEDETDNSHEISGEHTPKRLKLTVKAPRKSGRTPKPNPRFK